jgi:hypothetical protein
MRCASAGHSIERAQYPTSEPSSGSPDLTCEPVDSNGHPSPLGRKHPKKPSFGCHGEHGIETASSNQVVEPLKYAQVRDRIRTARDRHIDRLDAKWI